MSANDKKCAIFAKYLCYVKIQSSAELVTC